jgi:hypothetical protein
LEDQSKTKKNFYHHLGNSTPQTPRNIFRWNIISAVIEDIVNHGSNENHREAAAWHTVPTTQSVYNPVETAFVRAPYLTRPNPTSASRRSKLRVVGCLAGNFQQPCGRKQIKQNQGSSNHRTKRRMVDHAGVLMSMGS